MTTPTRLDILESRYTGKGDAMPGTYYGKKVDPKRTDTLAENLIGSGIYKDNGCHLAPACLSCPFSECQLITGSKDATEERNSLIWADYQAIMKPGVRNFARALSKKHGLSTRTIHRIVTDAKAGRGLAKKPTPKPNAHKLLTSGIFKQGMTWKKPIPTY